MEILSRGTFYYLVIGESKNLDQESEYRLDGFLQPGPVACQESRLQLILGDPYESNATNQIGNPVE